MEYVKLKNITTKITKGTTPSNINAEFTESGINYFRSEMLGKSKYLDKSDGILFISKETHEKLKRSHIKENDILFSMAGAYLGKLVIVSKDDIPANTNQAVAIIRFIDNINIDYVYYFMSQKSFTTYVNCMSAQAAQPNINLKQIGNLQIAFPNHDIQTKIASVLSTYDDLIETNNKRIKLLEQMAENLYKEWFVRFRFPGYENAEFENGIPKDWKIKSISDIAEINAGGDAPKEFSLEKTKEYPIPIYSNGIKDDGLYGYSNKATIKDNSITISARGTVGFVCLRDEPYLPIVRLISVHSLEIPLSINWLFLLLKNDIIEGYGTSQQQITVPYFKRKKILVPTEELICNFYEITKPIFSEKKKLKIINTNLIKQRDLLLPRLISGKLEVE